MPSLRTISFGLLLICLALGTQCRRETAPLPPEQAADRPSESDDANDADENTQPTLQPYTDSRGPANDSHATRPVAESPSPPPRAYALRIAPPAAAGPEIPPDLQPSRYANGHIGARITMQYRSEDGTVGQWTEEVLDIRNQNILVRHNTLSPFGSSGSTFTYSRSRPPQDQADRNESHWELVNLAGYRLLCSVRENRQAIGLREVIYRTWICPDIFGQIVRHADTYDGAWVTRLELLDVQP